jgi:O-antigen/teichoic acid export membrane protein
MVGCGVVFLYYELSVNTALLLYITGMIVSVGLEIYWLSKLKGGQIELDNSNKKEHVKVGIQLWLADVANTIIIRVDAFIVGVILDLKSVALYLAAQRISVLTTFIIDAVRTAIGTEISKSFDGDPSNEKYRIVVTKGSAMFALAGSIGVFGIIIVGYPLLALFGESYTDGYLIVLILTIGQSALIIFGPSALIMSMTNMERQRAIVTGFSAALVIALSWVGGVTYGITGIALSVAITMWINSSILAFLIWKNQKIISGILNRDSWEYFEWKNIHLAFNRVIQKLKK